jgi:co-chaperonin GroES (HSP10)
MANQAVVLEGEHLNIKPLFDRVLVRRVGPPADREGVIWIPDIAQDNTKTAIVMAVGPKVRGLKAGDEVLLPGVASKYPDWEKSDMMMVEEADIGGVFES